MSEDLATAALRRNDRFLLEFVEAFDLCPYARRCRETGGLERRVLAGDTFDVDAVVAEVVALGTASYAHVEVALLILPRLACTFAELERFGVRVREQAKAAGAEDFYLVPFHPEAPEDAADPHRLVMFLRRSPDPTFQLVRAALLERVRGPDVEDTVWLDPSQVDAPLPPPRKTVSTRIAEANHATVRRVGLDRLRALLTDLRA